MKMKESFLFSLNKDDKYLLNKDDKYLLDFSKKCNTIISRVGWKGVTNMDKKSKKASKR